MTKSKIKKIASEVGRLIKEEFKPKDVILFGSSAAGKSSKNSDFDILVIMETNLKPYKQATLIRMRLDEKLGTKFPMDLMVRTPQQIKERLQLGDFFIKSVVTKGIHL